jgi:hypothetical protein
LNFVLAKKIKHSRSMGPIRSTPVRESEASSSRLGGKPQR